MKSEQNNEIDYEKDYQKTSKGRNDKWQELKEKKLKRKKIASKKDNDSNNSN